MLEPPRFTDVLAARRRLLPYLQPTPTRRHPSLDRLLGTETWVKHDNLLPTGAFKVRGGINLVSQLGDSERRSGVVAASTGNHGQSIAYACRLFGISATICAPAEANPVKLDGMRELGAEVILEGLTYDDARLNAERIAAERGARYVHSGDEPDLIAGVATHTLELLEEAPQVETILVPIGGGSGAAGACLVARAVDAGIRVIGVQSAQSPAAHDSWHARELRNAANRTQAEGLSTGTAFELPQRMLWEMLDDFVTVDDSDLLVATAVMITKTRTLVEPAAAAPLAAAVHLVRQGDERVAGRRLALICSGANISPEQLRRVFAADAAA